MAGYGYNTGLDGHRVRTVTEREAEEIAQGLRVIYGRARDRMLTNVANRVSRGVHHYGWAERKANEAPKAVADRLRARQSVPASTRPQQPVNASRNYRDMSSEDFFALKERLVKDF